MRPLRILLVMPALPLPFGNAAARWFYVLLKELVERGHQVIAFAPHSSDGDVSKAKELFPVPQYDLRCYPYPQDRGLMGKIETIRQPYSYIFSPEFRQDLARELAKPYDILHLEELWSGWLGLKHTERAVISVLYLFSIDRVGQSPDSLEKHFRNFLSDRAEKRLLKAFPRIVTLSERLAQRIGQINPNAFISTIPLGIDSSLYPFLEQKQINEVPIVGLIGGFNWTPSYSAAERLLTRLWPEIKRQVPNARLQIVGRSAKNALAAFSNLPDLEIYQDVPDTLPYFANLDVMIYAPLAGSGMKVKILEAFALGTPVVTTSEGVEGLPAKDGVHAGICEDDRGLIERTVHLLKNPSQLQSQRIKARELLEKHCDPKLTVAKVEQVYEDILQ